MGHITKNLELKESIDISGNMRCNLTLDFSLLLISYKEDSKGKAWWRYWKYLKALTRELDENIALLRDRSTWHLALLGNLGMNMNLWQFLGVFCAKKLCENGILSLPWGPPTSLMFFDLRLEYAYVFYKVRLEICSKCAYFGSFKSNWALRIM